MCGGRWGGAECWGCLEAIHRDTGRKAEAAPPGRAGEAMAGGVESQDSDLIPGDS